MPLFELEGGRRAEPVATARPDDASFGDVLSVVLDHLPTLLGERLFMTAPDTSGSQVLALGDAVVLAIDATGDPLVVQAVPVLDGHRLVVALRAAGRAAGTTRGTLAATYATGPDRFHHDLAAFFDRDGRPRTAGSGRAARLVLVCAEIDDDAVDAVAFVSADAARVQVVTVGTVGRVAGPDGTTLLDVSMLRPGELAARRTVSIELDGASRADNVPAPQSTEQGGALPAFGRAEPHVGAPRAGRRPPPSPDITRARSTTGDDVTSLGLARPAARPAASSAGLPAAEMISAPAPAPAPAPRRPVAPDVSASVGEPYVPVFLDTVSLAALPARPADVPSLLDLGSVRGPRGVDLSRPAPAQAAPPAGAAPSVPAPSAAPPAAAPPETAPTAAASPVAVPPAAAAPVAGQPRAGGGPAHARLAVLARTLSAPVDLVWVRHRRGERFEVVLGLDGLLSAPDGTRYSDPDDAARTLSGTETSNGWRMWRAGEQGPSLDELAPST